MAIEYGSRMASLGEALGQGLSKGVESQLQLLQQKKLSDMLIGQGIKQKEAEQKQYASTLEPILGQQMAKFLGGLSPKEREVAFQNLGGLMQLGGQQMPQQGNLEQLMQQPLQQAQQQQMPQQGSAFNKLMQLQGAQQAQPGTWGAQQPMQQPMQYPQQQQIQPQANVPQTREQLLQDIFTPESTKRARQELALKQKKAEQEERKMSQSEKLAAFKETKKYRDEVREKAKSAREDLRSLDRMEELQNSGNLTSPGWHEFLTRSGLDVGSLTQPESEEFNKLMYGFLKDAKNIYGSRVTNYDVQTFLKSIPTMSNSNSGRSRIIANLKRLAKGEVVYQDTMNEIMKENKGVPPFDLAEQVEDRIKGKLDVIYNQFRKDLEKPTPPEQNKYITGAGAIAGSAAGMMPGVLKAAVPGAIGGLIAGVPGALGGAGLGILSHLIGGK